MTPDNARILADFGLRASDLIGEGGESLVYALGTSHVLRLPKRHPFDPRSRRRLQAFLAGIHGRLPFETPLIEEIGPNEAYTIEPRVPGKPMAEFLRAANDDLRDHALRNYVAAIDAFRTIEFPHLPYGHILAGHPVNAGDWRTFVRDSLSRFRTVNRVAIAGAVGDPYRLFDKAADMIDQLPQHPPKYLVHGDYFPGNVLLAPDLSIAGVIDFGPFTVAGDPVLDLAGGDVGEELERLGEHGGDSHPRVERLSRMLEHHLDPAPDVPPAEPALDGVALEGDGSGGGGLQTDHDTSQRGLPASRLPYQTQGLAGVEGQIDPPDGGHRPGARPKDLVDRAELKQ